MKKKLIPIPGMNEKRSDVTFASVAKEYPWLAPNVRPEELRELMQAIGQHARARASHDAGDPTEAIIAVVQEAADRARAAAEIDTVAAATWFVDDEKIEPDASISDELLAFQVARRDEEQRISRQLDEIVARARDLNASIQEFKRQNEETLERRAGGEDALRREFVRLAAAAWKTTTGKAPRRSRSGPFARFCAVAWIECGLPKPKRNPLAAIGASIERVIPKMPQKPKG